MRILYWSEAFFPNISGGAIAATRLLLLLKEQGHEMIVAAQGDRGAQDVEERTYQGVPLYRFPFYEALESRDAHRISDLKHRVAALKKEFEPDLVHGASCQTSSYFHLETARQHALPYLTTVHGFRAHHLLQPHGIVGRTLRAADAVVCVSAALRDDVVTAIPQIREDCRVIHNFVDDAVRPLTAPPMNPPALLAVGRLAPEKGFDLLITALPRVLKTHPNAHLTVIGDGPEREHLTGLAREKSLMDHIHFVGWVAPEKIPERIESSSVVVMSSNTEAHPLVALEAGQCGRPVVATNVGGLPEVVVHEETGLLVKPGQPEALADALVSLLDQPERAQRMGVAAQARVHAQFSRNQCLRQYEQLYKELTTKETSYAGTG